MLRTLTIGTVALAALLVASVPSGMAHEQTELDADDSHSPLDIVAARQRHRVFTEAQTHPGKQFKVTELRYRLVTYEKWEREIVSGNHNFISFEFNLDDDPVIERCLVITNGEFEMLGRMYKNCNYFDDELVGSASVSRPDKHSLVTAFPRRLLRKGITKWRWRAVTSYEEQDQSSSCPASEPHGDGGYGTCSDFTDWKKHKL
jgi:uncharacterized protein YcnI